MFLKLLNIAFFFVVVILFINIGRQSFELMYFLHVVTYAAILL